MTFKDLANKRFACRKYTDEPVSKADIEYIMDCVRLAPSAHNFQPWKFLVVTSEEGKEKVRQCYDRPWLANVPMFVLCFTSMSDAWVRTDDNKIMATSTLALQLNTSALLLLTVISALAGYATTMLKQLSSCSRLKTTRLWL